LLNTAVLYTGSQKEFRHFSYNLSKYYPILIVVEMLNILKLAVWRCHMVSHHEYFCATRETGYDSSIFSLKRCMPTDK